MKLVNARSFLGLALALLTAAAPASAGRFQERMAMLEERGFTVEAYQDTEQGLRVLVVTNPENGRQKMRGIYKDGRRFRARRQDESSEWEFQGSEEGMEVPDVASMEPIDLPIGENAGEDPQQDPDQEAGEDAVDVDANADDAEPEPQEGEVTIPASE
jgi:hypothetical protein